MTKILVVDDCADLRWTIAEHFKLYGLIVVEASNGEEALKVLEAFSPKFVLTDIDMPKMSGISFLREARARYPELPIFVMTAHSVHSKSEVMKLGASGYSDKTSILKLIESLGKEFGVVARE